MTATGQHISHYRILEKLGEGGMGVVYKAVDLKLNRSVALKFLPSGISHTESELRRFHQEASALSSLNHPNIATIYEIDEADGKRFIALEYLPGGTVRSHVRDLVAGEKEVPVGQMVSYGLQIASGLSHAHRNGVIHRDVKTENMLLTADGKVKITDFGLARLGGESTVTKTGSQVGTAAYMSPEQIRGEQVDERSDIFSLGVVLYEMATGRLPFRGDHEAAVTYSILNTDPEDLSTLRQTLPPELRDVILTCLQKERARRYRNCDEIIRVLEKIQSGEKKLSPEMEMSPRKISRAFMAVIVVVAIGLFGGLSYVFMLQFIPEPAQFAPSIAVLYVENMTKSEAYDSFSMGMTEEIINELANVPGLQIISRSNVVQYQNKPVDVREIGEQLGVAYVLESSVRAEGKKIRLTCQAIQTADRFHFWSQAYTRELTSGFEVQNEIAREIALSLKTKFAQKEIEQKLGLPLNSLLKEKRLP